MDSGFLAFGKPRKAKEKPECYHLTRHGFNEMDTRYEVVTGCGAIFQERPTLVFAFQLSQFPYSVCLTRHRGDKFCLSGAWNRTDHQKKSEGHTDAKNEEKNPFSQVFTPCYGDASTNTLGWDPSPGPPKPRRHCPELELTTRRNPSMSPLNSSPGATLARQNGGQNLVHPSLTCVRTRDVERRFFFLLAPH